MLLTVPSSRAVRAPNLGTLRLASRGTSFNPGELAPSPPSPISCKQHPGFKSHGYPVSGVDVAPAFPRQNYHFFSSTLNIFEPLVL